MTAGRSIDYEGLAQEAMRGVVRQVLTRTAKTGLPGDHHFYISFDTQVPGVVLSKRLKEKYPAEMTIVLQHRFWDLAVTDERFEVKLTFDGIPERLVVPFASIKVFFDPSVRYGLQFDEPDWGQDGQGGGKPFGPEADDGERPATVRSAAQRKRPLRKPRIERVETTETQRPLRASEDLEKPESKPREGPAVVPPPPPAAVPAPAAAKAPDLKPVPPASGAQIVSLSDFRKK